MSVRSIIAGGIDLVRTQPRVVAIWIVIYLVGAAAAMVALRPFMADMIVFQQEVAARGAAGMSTPPVFPAGVFGWLILMEVVFLILGIVAFAAVVRATARPGGDRFAYLRLGMDELRLLGLGVLLVIAALAAEIVAIIALVLAGVLARLVAGDGATVAVVAILAILLVAAAIWAEVRLSLAGALTVIRGRIVIIDAWRATRGRFWTLLGVYAVLTIAFMVVGVVMVALSNPGLLAAYARLDQQAMANAAAAQLARQAAGLSVGMVVQMMAGSAVMVVIGAVTIGSVATAALELGDRGDGPRIGDQSVEVA